MTEKRGRGMVRSGVVIGLLGPLEHHPRMRRESALLRMLGAVCRREWVDLMAVWRRGI